MNKVKLTTYRGIDIYYDIDGDKVIFSLGEDDPTLTKASIKIAQAYINEHFKNNQDFKPFGAFEYNGYSFRVNQIKTVTVTGIRKDGCFIYKTKDGKTGWLSKYDVKRYFYCDVKNENIFGQIALLEVDIDNIKKRIEELKNDLILKPLSE